MKMQSVLWTLILTAALVGPPPAATPPKPGNPDKGMMIFATYCAACHGEDGRGDGPVAARLARDHGVTPADLTTSAFQQRSSDGGLAKAIREGGRGVHRSQYMPAWGMTLNESQIQDLVAFVRELGHPLPGEERGSFLDIQTQLELGRTLYSLHCVACHGAAGRGDGPFVEAASITTPATLAQASYYADKTDQMLARWVDSGLEHAGLKGAVESWWNRKLDPAEKAALILYLRCLPLGQPRRSKA